jgi:hypothetical protein
MSARTIAQVVCMLGVVALLPETVFAQAIGIGPKLSFVRTDTHPATDATRLVGGTLRMRSSKRMSIEATLDYRSEFSDGRTQRIREMPIQFSMLIYPVRGVISPYLLAGFGLYTEHTDRLNNSGIVLETTTERRTGWHMGLGGEVFVVRQMALFVDYRWRFVRFGEPESGADPIDIPGIDSLKLSHRGSMWTSGMAFYF